MAEENARIAAQRSGDRARLVFEGAFHAANARDIHQVAMPLFDHGLRELEIDLGSVHFLGSAAVGMIVYLTKRGARENVRVYISHTPDAIMQVFQVLNLLPVLEFA